MTLPIFIFHMGAYKVEFSTFIMQVFHGLVWGMALALIAVGLTLIFGVMRVVNFAHGEMFMLGAYFGYTGFLLFNNFWIALLFSCLVLTAIALFLEYMTIRPLYGRDPMFFLLVTFGVSMVLVELARLVWGPVPKSLPPPITGSISLWGLSYPIYRIFLLVCSSLLISGVWLFLHKSRFGAQILAASQDPDMLGVLGVNVPFIYRITFVLGTILAGIGGVLMAPILGVYNTLGMDVILIAFAVVIVGGMGSFPGAVLAAIIIGEVESLGSLWIAPTVAKNLTFLIMAVILLVRPEGLFKEA